MTDGDGGYCGSPDSSQPRPFAWQASFSFTCPKPSGFTTSCETPEKMALYLVQHGKCLSKAEDPERGLGEIGMAEVSSVATRARDGGVVVSGVCHSGKKRAWQTAEIFATNLFPEGEAREMSGLTPLDDVAALVENLGFLQNNGGGLMLVGHLPFMEKMAAYLLTGSNENLMVKFQNGGIVCLDKETDLGSWFVKWMLVPNLTE